MLMLLWPTRLHCNQDFLAVNFREKTLDATFPKGAISYQNPTPEQPLFSIIFAHFQPPATIKEFSNSLISIKDPAASIGFIPFV